MQAIGNDLGVPVYLKTETDMEWPEDRLFYLMTKNGLFICRNHQWWRSCAPARQGPSELEEQKAFVKLDYPLIPKVLIEKAVGFFHEVFKKEHWESAVMIVWNKATEAIELLAPPQENGWSSVNYDLPALPPQLLYIGDIHSHCDFSAKSSWTDEHDEINRPGLHLVVGKLQKEPPDLYAVVVVDGTRFEVTDPKTLFEDYVQRNPDFPKEWLEKVKEKKYAYQTTSTWQGEDGYMGGYYGGVGFHGYRHDPPKGDKEIIAQALAEELSEDKPPDFGYLKNKLFRLTKDSPYLYCERRAEQFIRAWPKLKRKHEKANPLAA